MKKRETRAERFSRQLRDAVSSLEGFALAPVVVLVAFEAAVFGAAGGRRRAGVAALASLDAGDEHVRSLLAGGGVGVAGDAIQRAVRFVTEDGVGHPALRDLGGLDHRQRRRASRKIKLMALAAGLAPQQIFRLSDATIHPL